MQDLIEVKIKYTEVAKKLQESGTEFVLWKANPTDSGFDLQAAILEPTFIAPGERKLIPVGIHIQLESGWEAQVRSRSGLALKQGLSNVNGIGTIDHLYRKEIGAILINHGQLPIEIFPGMKVAQLCFNRVPKVSLINEDFEDTERGGFGSTGV